MLKLDPNQRISAAEALKHPFFDIVRSKKIRLQKTSESWMMGSKKPKIDFHIDNYTDREI